MLVIRHSLRFNTQNITAEILLKIVTKEIMNGVNLFRIFSLYIFLFKCPLPFYSVANFLKLFQPSSVRVSCAMRTNSSLIPSDLIIAS